MKKNSARSTRLQGLVTFDRQSFLVGGRRVWLHCAEIHYFRHPCELWRETLLRAKAAGLNTISTYIAWNFHEQVEGQVDFTGDRDIGRYLDLCADLGLYVVARPGPYICSEWDGGGLPAWLLGKPGIRTRDDDPAFIDSMRRWFGRLLPLIAERQVSRGGPVILVQNENEYGGGWNDSTRRYTRTINAIFREAGIDVPIIACNAHGKTPTTVQINYSTDPADQMLWPEMVVTYNWGPGAEPLRDLRRKQPNAPLLMTEYWAGPQVFWGKPLGDWCAAPEYARSMLEFASLGCQVTYYMFDGGTNFGYWAGSNIATSYQSNYPVREGGVLWEKYHRLKPVNHFITQFGDCLADSEEVADSLGIRGPEGLRLVARRCPAGHLLFVSDAGPRPAATLALPGGASVDVALPFIRSLVLPFKLEVLPGVSIDFSNLGLLGRARGAVVLWGVAGTRGAVSVNGRLKTVTVPADRAARLTFGKAKVFVVGEELAGRTWFPDDGRIVFGADFAVSAGKGVSICCSVGTPAVQCVSARGTASEVALPAIPPPPSVPVLGEWEAQPCAEAAGGGSGWQALPEGPKSHEDLGRLLGYVWYRAEYEAEADAVLPLCIPFVSTRLTVYVNGLYGGTAGEITRFVDFRGYRHPADAFQQEQVLVPVRKGRNTLVFLSDHLGRQFGGYPDPQGLPGPVYLAAQRLSFGEARPLAPAPLSDEAFQSVYCKWFRVPKPLPGVELAVQIPAETDAYCLVPAGLSCVAISVDGRHVAGLAKVGYPFSTVRLPGWSAGKTVTVRLQCETVWGAVAPSFDHVYLLLAPRRRALANWSWKPGGEWPGAADSASAGRVTVGKAEGWGGLVEWWGGLVPDQAKPTGGGRTCPTYYRTTFPMPDGEQPVFLDIGRLHKGQLFLNGRNLGRFWQAGVQSRYFLPRPWMRETNTLAVLEESGLPPNGVTLAWGAGPYASVDV